MAREGVCTGCGFGGMRDCDELGRLGWYCGCGAAHGHDPLVKSKCIWLYPKEGHGDE